MEIQSLSTEENILQNLLMNEHYFNTTYEFLQEELFESSENKFIFKKVKDFSSKYGTKPSPKEVGLSISSDINTPEQYKKTVIQQFRKIILDPKIDNQEFMLERTKKWVQKQKLSLSIFKAADIIQKGGEFEPIVGMIEDSLNVDFDKDFGLDYSSSLQDRITYYKRKIKGIPSGIPGLDKALGGGFMDKTLNLFASVSFGGKCHEYNTILKIHVPKNIVEDMEKRGFNVRRKSK